MRFPGRRGEGCNGLCRKDSKTEKMSRRDKAAGVWGELSDSTLMTGTSLAVTVSGTRCCLHPECFGLDKG